MPFPTPGQTEHRCRRCARLGRNPYHPVADFPLRRDGSFRGWCRTCDRESRRETRRRVSNSAPSRPVAPVGERRFGCEIEFIGDRYAVETELARRGVRVANESYNHRVQSYWKIVPDASVYNGDELVSPPLSGAEGERQIRLVAEAMAAAGARVNNSTGFHVHHDMGNLSADVIKRGVKTYHNCQAAIDGLVARSRRGSCQFAHHLTSTELNQIEAAADVRSLRAIARYINRFRAVNVNAYAKYGTIEIRQHQGTLNAKKMIAWIRFGQAIFNYAEAGGSIATTDASEMIDTLSQNGLDTDTANYLRTRARHFARTVAWA